MRKTTRLRELIKKPGVIVMPMAYDALSAKLMEWAGFEVVGITGAGVSASLLGASDVGLLTMTEMVGQAKNIAGATNLPVVADAEAGYGSALSVMRTVREFENAGVAGIYMEDQVMPKKCGHFEGKRLVSRAEMVGKIKAAQEARQDRDMVIIARTDAIAVDGFEEAILRANAYAEAGADMIFVEAPTSVEQLEKIPILVHAPIMVNLVEGGKTPLLRAKALGEMGFKLISYSGSAMRTAAKAMQEVLLKLKNEGTTEAFFNRMISFEERNEILGLKHFQDLEKRFSPREGEE
ncbi:MAG: oxaloacetate decarboxylase [Chloroflexi bacterium]|nr:oxaloacetate decarboxylase [Chloroflexota bacterium]